MFLLQHVTLLSQTSFTARMAPLWNQASDERPFKYEPINQSEDMMTLNRLGLIVVGVVFTLIGAVTMSLRTLTVLKKRRTAGLDDLIILTAWLFSIGFTIASYLSVRWGVGLLEKNAPLGWQTEAIKVCHKHCGRRRAS